jgi:hypothetical protein
MVDDDGRSLPKAVVPAFRQREQLRALCRRIEALAQEIQHLSSSPVGAHLDIERVLNSLDAARRALVAAEPARVCPHVPGYEVRCEVCRGHGWLPAGLRDSSATGQPNEPGPAPM